MLKLLVILFSIGGLATAIAAPQMPASARAGHPGSKSSSPVYTITQKATNMSPIIVYGQHIPFPLALQLYKKALTQPWSSNPSDRHKLVCRWRAMVGTHLQTLMCQTNAQHEKLASATQLGWTNGGYAFGSSNRHPILLAFEAGMIPVVLANSTTQTPIRRGPAAALLAKLPPANASYTLRVTGKGGRPILDYVFKHGNLVHIYHYVYKNGKAAKSKH